MLKKILVFFLLFTIALPNYGILAEELSGFNLPQIPVRDKITAPMQEIATPPADFQSYIPESIYPITDYKLGCGDIIGINIWKQDINLSYTLGVSPEGKIFIPRIGSVLVNNLTTPEVEKLIKKKIKDNINVSVILKHIRSIKVFVTGQVKLPGIYVIPAQTRISEIIKMVGWTMENGSLRKISVNYDNQKTTIDLYKFMYEGDLDQNPKIDAGAHIMIPLIEKKVLLTGQVPRPGIFEILNDDKFNNILEYSGGTLPDAALNEVSLWRDGLNGNIKDPVKLDLIKQTAPDIHDGDVINIPSYKVQQETKFVYLTGQLKKTGAVPFKVGYKLSDYINQAGGATDQADLTAVQLTSPRFDKNGTPNVQTINFYKILYEGKMELDPDIKENDIVYIPEKFFYFRNFTEVTGLALTLLGMASLIFSLTKQ